MNRFKFYNLWQTTFCLIFEYPAGREQRLHLWSAAFSIVETIRPGHEQQQKKESPLNPFFKVACVTQITSKQQCLMVGGGKRSSISRWCGALNSIISITATLKLPASRLRHHSQKAKCTFLFFFWLNQNSHWTACIDYFADQWGLDL